jgi:hypothetical protein
MTRHDATITRKELAWSLGYCYKTIQRNERHWGLASAICRTQAKPRLYYLAIANRELKKRRLISDLLSF